MVAIGKPRSISPQEYLKWERKAETKSEYDDGVLMAMAGASEAHNTITFNIVTELGPQLKRGDCRGYSADMRVRAPQCNRYYYPDVVVVCGDPQFEDAEVDTLLNPTLIIEVLSDSTEVRDRGDKMLCYRTLASLNTYVLVAQERAQVEVYRRQTDGWLHTVTQGLDTTLTLEAIGCTLLLSDIYARVTFPPPAPPDTSEEAR